MVLGLHGLRLLGQTDEHEFKYFYENSFLQLLAIFHDACDEITIRMDLNMNIFMHSNRRLIV